MNVNSIEFDKLNNAFWNWLSINDLTPDAIRDPRRSARFGAYAMKMLGNIVDGYDISEFVGLQIDSLDMFGEVQK